MHKLLLLLLILIQTAFAQTRPNTPFWSLVGEIEKTGLVAYERFNWSERNLNKLLQEVPVIRQLENSIGRHKIVYRLGGENPGKAGFTTVLKNGDIFIQVYYAKHLKNIDVALTLGHELVHATHIDSGLHDMWRGLVKREQKEYAECQSEMGAYTWSAIYASNQSTRDWIAEQVNYYQSCTARISKLR